MVARTIFALVSMSACTLMQSTSHADDSDDLQSAQIESIKSTADSSSTEDLKKLIALTADHSAVATRWQMPTKLTISQLAGDRLANLKHNQKVRKLAFAKLQDPDLSVEQFGQLLRAVDFNELSDLNSARLQERTSQGGKAFLTEFLTQIGSSDELIDDKFDLSIADGLKADSVQCVAAACRSIVNRRSRNVLWNKDLVSLCETPLSGHLSSAPDMAEEYDFRCLVLHALRRNGYPSGNVRGFLESFAPKPGTELFWQYIATKYEILNDQEALDLLLSGLEAKESRPTVAKVLNQDVDLPDGLSEKLLSLAQASDGLTASRLASVIITHCEPSDFTPSQLADLNQLFNEYSMVRFKTWIERRRPIERSQSPSVLEPQPRNEHRPGR